MRDLPAGWGWPGQAKKCHWFPSDSTEALCGKWGFFFGPREPDSGTSSDDCVACRRRLDASIPASTGADTNG
jgi:hypothetical protein